MALQDFEVFLRERLATVDDTFDLSPGSPLDAKFIQPVLRRLGTDPFTVDLPTFIGQRLAEAFPDLAASDGDAISDTLVKPLMLLLDPLIRETQRVKNSQSFQDPEILTTEEADALGANLFAERNRGNVARCTFRLYFAQPQKANVSQENFVSTRGGLHFFPTNPQSISSEEMAVNLEGSLYYFDISTVAERAGDEYNIESGEGSTIANMPAAVRLTNKVRARGGLPEEDAPQYIGRIPEEMSERSLATVRGALSKLPRAFPEITRLAVVGFNDPEMQRDVLTGGSLGPILALGSDAIPAPDGEAKALTRRVSLPSADLYAVLGPAGPVTGYTLTVSGLFGPDPPAARDLRVSRVINQTTLELADQVVYPATATGHWTLRRAELRLADIPGGILFPDGPNGTVAIEPDKVHIGGMSDFLIRSSGLSSGVLVIDQASDDAPALQGTQLVLVTNLSPPPASFVTLNDYVLGTNYQQGDGIHRALLEAKERQNSLEILEGVAAGVYRILDVVQLLGASPILYLDPLAVVAAGTYRWRIVQQLTIDLVDPRETRVEGSNGQTVQGEDTFTTESGVDFQELGVSEKDVLRITSGPDAGDFLVKEVTPPFYTTLRLDRELTSSRAGLTYSVFRANTGGGVLRPLVRVTSIDVLDTNRQPIGTKVPYAKAVDARSQAFQNPGVGVKVDISDGRLGLMTQGLPSTFGITGGVIALTWDGATAPLSLPMPVLTSTTVAALVTLINASSQGVLGFNIARELVVGSTRYIGITPIGPNTRLHSSSTPTLVIQLFGTGEHRSSRDVRSDSIAWANIDPALDALHVVDGPQAGFASNLVTGTTSPGFGPSAALVVDRDFAPEVGRTVRVGARSIGAVRIFFLDPTSVEIDQGTVFTSVLETGVSLNFRPDPTLSYQVMPPLPNGEKSHTGEISASNLFEDPELDFVRKGIREGDVLVIDFVPVLGSQNLADPVPSLALKDLALSLDGQPDKVIVFVNDVDTPNAVSRDGVAEQINSAVGLEIASIVEASPGDFRLKFDPELALIIRPQVGSSTSANVALGFSTTTDTGNRSPNAGRYRIIEVGGAQPSDTLTVTNYDGSAAALGIGDEDQQYSIVREGYQRIVSTDMAANKAAAGLYYWDVELVSEGPGNLWNIEADLALAVTGYRSDGYYLTTSNDTSSFSSAETLSLILSKSVLDVGVDDDPENAVQLSGQSLLLAYEYAPTVDTAQSFVMSDSERVVNQNPLVRHLKPHFVRFDISYVGGAPPADVKPVLEKYVRELRPDEGLESSDLQRIVSGKGATSIRNPIEIVAVVHNQDRSIIVARSKDVLTTGRIAAFIPDLLNVERRVR
jgi:hypothetical protein